MSPRIEGRRDSVRSSSLGLPAVVLGVVDKGTLFMGVQLLREKRSEQQSAKNGTSPRAAGPSKDAIERYMSSRYIRYTKARQWSSNVHGGYNVRKAKKYQ